MMNLREIDRLVATKVLRLKEGKCPITDRPIWLSNDIYFADQEDFRPSEDIFYAWEVVEKLIDNGYNFNIYNHNKEFNVEINLEENDEHLWFYGEADFAPLAICIAALQTVGVEVEVNEQ
jgi:hypothetical protein